MSGTVRSASPSIPQPAQARRNHQRQPSPPVQPNSQAEKISFATNVNNNRKSNLFDPFVVSSDSDSDTAPSHAVAPFKGAAAPVRSTPQLANPSGKLARRRQPATVLATPTPAPSKPVSVPRAQSYGRSHGRTHSAMMNLSRSAPSPSPAVSAFPICDDNDNELEVVSPPATPTRAHAKASTWQQQAFDDGPRTAPLSSTFGFPFGGMATPSPASRRQRQHVRSPSEGVFNMSFDEDSSSSDNASEELKMLFGLMPKRASYQQYTRPAAQTKAQLYASSLFQNSPSPDELPPPAF